GAASVASALPSLRKGDADCRSRSAEGAIVIAVELVEQLRSCTLRFGEIDRAVIIRVECFDQTLRPRWRGADHVMARVINTVFPRMLMFTSSNSMEDHILASSYRPQVSHGARSNPQSCPS